jgi:hypothetical protein
MKVMYQDALSAPTLWQETDAVGWALLPKRPIPLLGERGGRDNDPGWVRNVSVQGLTVEGFDHIAIESVAIGLDEGVRLTTWNDDLDDIALGERSAIVWTILPLAPDPALGMAINTRQSCIRYCEGERYDRFVAQPPQNTTVRPWSEFEARMPTPAVTRHGIWLPDAKWEEHARLAPQWEWGYNRWIEHLPEDETELQEYVTPRDELAVRRVLREQRAQGRYRQAAQTITYYQRDTARAWGYGAWSNEDAFELTTAASGTQSVTTNATSVEAWSFLTPANEPNVAGWPNGTYHCQLNCTAASTGLTYGLVSGSVDVFGRSTTSTLLESTIQAEAAFSGTGLKLASKTYGFAAGAATDIFSCSVNATGDSHGDAITLQLNTTDSYADGPWSTVSQYPRSLIMSQAVKRSSYW